MTVVNSPSAPLVSVIIATYNYGHFIAQTLTSLQAQTYQNWECLVVDDGSTDDTRAVVTRFAAADGRIQYVYQENARQAAARNNGLRHRQGGYIQFLDADDLLESQKLERQVAYLECHPDVDIVYGSVRFFRTERPDERLFSMAPENEPWLPEISGSGKDILLALAHLNILVINSALLRRSVVDDVGFFDEALPPLEDWDYFIRCAAQRKRFQFENPDGTLALVRSHPSSTSKNKERMCKMDLLVRTKLNTLTDDPDVLKINREMIVQAKGFHVLLEAAGGGGGGRFSNSYQLLQASVRSRKVRWCLKWFVYAILSLFAPGRWLHRLAFSPASERTLGALRILKKRFAWHTHGRRRVTYN